MDSETGKISKSLTKDETKALLSFIEASKVINNKTTNATTNKLKNEEWRRIADLFNATVTTCRRTPQQLRLKWENLKKNSRKRSTAIRMNNIKTGGGGPDYIPPDDILDCVSSLLGSTVGSRKRTKDENQVARRNAAIADYYITKNKILQFKLDNILLENEKLKLEIKELKKRDVQVINYFL